MHGVCSGVVMEVAQLMCLTGRAIFVMPEGLSDGGDDSAGGQGGKSFSLEGFGEHWAVLVNGPMSDEIQA